mmetsp:Transcript_106611/g.308944  ORF Transcript_106611/g.308944 Transcript_106611/m.308944 type:complete len:235 (+) Transcript_106611:5209-5913(+)
MEAKAAVVLGIGAHAVQGCRGREVPVRRHHDVEGRQVHHLKIIPDGDKVGVHDARVHPSAAESLNHLLDVGDFFGKRAHVGLGIYEPLVGRVNGEKGLFVRFQPCVGALVRVGGHSELQRVRNAENGVLETFLVLDAVDLEAELVEHDISLASEAPLSLEVDDKLIHVNIYLIFLAKRTYIVNMHRTIVLVGGDALLEKAHRDIGGNIIVAIEHDNLGAQRTHHRRDIVCEWVA